MQRTADVIIIGAGVMGCSIACHLAKMGYRDILALKGTAQVLARQRNALVAQGSGSP